MAWRQAAAAMVATVGRSGTRQEGHRDYRRARERPEQGRDKGPTRVGSRAGARVAGPVASSSWPRAIRDRGRDRAAAAGRWPVGEGALRGSAVRHRRPPGRRPLPRSGAEQGREREERERGSNCFFSQKKSTELEI